MSSNPLYVEVGEVTFVCNMVAPQRIKIDRTRSFVRVTPTNPELGNIEPETLKSIAAAFKDYCLDEEELNRPIELFKIVEDKDGYMDYDYLLWVHTRRIGCFDVLFYKDHDIYPGEGLDLYELTIEDDELADRASAQ